MYYLDFFLRATVAAFLLGALIACSDGSDSPVLPEPRFRPDAPGPYSVGHATFTAVDISNAALGMVG